MRLDAVHVCPVWACEQRDLPVIGFVEYQIYGFAEPPEVAGWCNVGVISGIDRYPRLLLLTGAT